MKRLRRLIRLLALTGAAILLIYALIDRPDRQVPAPDVPRTPLTGQIDRILIEKGARTLTVFRDGQALRTYPIALGFAPAGDKQRQGDGKTPEGQFRIDRRNGQSAFHLSLGIDYPQRDDVVRARAGGYAPGGDIFIHGQPNRRAGQPTLRGDWTAGCIAVSDAEIEELWRIAPLGTPVEIRP